MVSQRSAWRRCCSTSSSHTLDLERCGCFPCSSCCQQTRRSCNEPQPQSCELLTLSLSTVIRFCSELDLHSDSEPLFTHSARSGPWSASRHVLRRAATAGSAQHLDTFSFPSCYFLRCLQLVGAGLFWQQTFSHIYGIQRIFWQTVRAETFRTFSPGSL